MITSAEFERLLQSTCEMLKGHAPLLEEDAAAAQVEQLARLDGLLDAADPVDGTALVVLRPALVAALLTQLGHALARVAAVVEATGADARPLRVRLDHLHHERDKLLPRLLRQGRGPDAHDERMSP